ncbi:hypothetical protein CDAR_505293 [Caerostris darwini]|uniref:Uncharacterized protein n=1 Tax=Caerostris darwini TaxID=1538125 RepID=A0AAV4R1N5_9ARAC|nr:hypothetical protein CDAR_505293 [Caerostris darwini]
MNAVKSEGILEGTVDDIIGPDGIVNGITNVVPSILDFIGGAIGGALGTVSALFKGIRRRASHYRAVMLTSTSIGSVQFVDYRRPYCRSDIMGRSHPKTNQCFEGVPAYSRG